MNEAKKEPVPVSGDSLYQEIIANAREICDSVEAQMRNVAEVKVPAKVWQTFSYHEEIRSARLRYLSKLYIQKEKDIEMMNIDDRNSDEQYTVADAAPRLSHISLDLLSTCDIEASNIDKALSSLDQVYEANKDGGTHVFMESANSGPVYDTWFPVLQNFFVANPDIDPYRPYFGEHRRGVKKAGEVYKQMLHDATGPDRFAYESDGDYGDDREDLVDDSVHYLSHLRKRASQRQAIMEVTKRFGKGDSVWSALSIALGIDESRICAYELIGEAREASARDRAKRREKGREFFEMIRKVVLKPSEGTSEECLSDSSSNASQYFCFNCHIFACQRHQGENVVPFKPIPDHATQKRLMDLQRKRAKPCSRKCFLLEGWEQDPSTEGENQTWTSEEVALMREGGAIFEVDPCSLAMIVGTKSCRQVHVRLQLVAEKDVVRKQFQKHGTPRAHFPCRTAGTAARRGRDRSSRRTRGRSRSRTSQGLKSTRLIENEEETPDNSEHDTFVPCNHPGLCTVANGCVCIQRKLRCQSTCGCNFGRFEVTGQGVAWKAPLDSELKDETAVKCKNRPLGCKCKSGSCNTENCECYFNNRVCNPDFCNNCGASILPQHIRISSRRCRNVDLITGRHRKTVSGKSEIHGFGLFAADNFLRGELIGHYSGRTVDPMVVDKMLRSSEARKRTYAFNLTDRYVIDGMCLGGKVRYINHSAEDANCEARFERVRGEGRIAIRATKPVKAGQEFLFDYKITSGNEWLNAASDESESDSEFLESSPYARVKEEPMSAPSTPNARKSVAIRPDACF